MSRGRKLTKAEKRERRRSSNRSAVPVDEAEALIPVVAGLGSAARAAETAASICMNRLDELVSDTTVARIAHEIWKDCAGPATPLAANLAGLVEELVRHRDRLRDLYDRFVQITDSGEELPVLPNAELAAALERVVGARSKVVDPPVGVEQP